jgi:membrane fusion protein (multidrug efflux system)
MIAVLAAGLALSGCGGRSSEAQPTPEAEKEERRKVKVSVVEVKPTTVRDVLVLPGQSEPWKDVTIAAEQTGQLEWLGVKEGDRVQRDQELARIDVESLKAQLENAQASHRLAKDLYERRQKLFERKIISREELDQARTEHTVARGQLKSAQLAHEKGVVTAPIDGIINRVYVDQGEFVTHGTPIVDVVNVDQIEINVNVPELDVRHLEEGQPAMVRFDALPEQNIGGVIDFVAYKADPATKTFQTKVLVDNADENIRPGMIARVAIMRRVVPDALVAPLFAMVDRGGERLVYVVEDGVAKARPVGIGVIEGDTVQITSGLNPGDQLIVTGQNDVQEGTKVVVE